MDEVCTKLIAIFQIVNDWLKFAEAKNAVLLTFCGAGITAIVTVLATAQKVPNFLQVGFLITTAMLCVCALICSLSFLPKTDLERILWFQKIPSRNQVLQPNNTDNLYFFGHLQKYNSTILLDALNKDYFDGKIITPYKKEYLDLASQITINAIIASGKFKIFKNALYILIVSIFVALLSILASLISLIISLKF